MLSIIIMLVIGLLAGYLLRKAEILRHVGKLISMTIFVMLFVLGLSIGADENIMGNLQDIGLTSLLLAVAGISGSVLLSWLVYKFFYADKKEFRFNIKEAKNE